MLFELAMRTDGKYLSWIDAFLLKLTDIEALLVQDAITCRNTYRLSIYYGLSKETANDFGLQFIEALRKLQAIDKKRKTL